MDDRAWAPQRKILPGAAGRVLVPGHPWALGGLWRDLQVVAAWGGGLWGGPWGPTGTEETLGRHPGLEIRLSFRNSTDIMAGPRLL